MFQEFFTADVKISNHAKSGKSSKSYRHQGFWKVVLDSLQAGDYVIIQFGHNDSKPDTARYTDPRTTYRQNLERYIREIREKGAHPLLCTSIVRRRFNDRGEFVDTLDDYPKVVREVAAALQVPLLDLHRRTMDLIVDMGPEESKRLFLHLKRGESKNWPEGKEDNTHLNPEGARAVALLAAGEIRKNAPGLGKYLRKRGRTNSPR